MTIQILFLSIMYTACWAGFRYIVKKHHFIRAHGFDKNRKFVQYHNNKAIDLCKMTAYNKNVPRERGHGSRPIEGREILEIPLKEGTVMKKNF